MDMGNVILSCFIWRREEFFCFYCCRVVPAALFSRDTHRQKKKKKNGWRHWNKNLMQPKHFLILNDGRKLGRVPGEDRIFPFFSPSLTLLFRSLRGSRTRPCLIHHHHLIRFVMIHSYLTCYPPRALSLSSWVVVVVLGRVIIFRFTEF